MVTGGMATGAVLTGVFIADETWELMGVRVIGDRATVFMEVSATAEWYSVATAWPPTLIGVKATDEGGRAVNGDAGENVFAPGSRFKANVLCN